MPTQQRLNIKKTEEELNALVFFVLGSRMDLQNYYRSLLVEEDERDILCLLLDQKSSQFALGLKQLSKKTSTHLGERDLAQLLKDILPQLIASKAFVLDNNEYLSPKEALDMIDSVLYLEILFEEFMRKSGRRGFFIANYKAVNPEWCYFAYEFILSRAMGISTKDLLALSVGLKQYDLKIISNWSKIERMKRYVNLTRKKQIGVFQDGSFVGFKNYKRINDVEDILQIIFDEINLLTSFFLKKEGSYYELYGEIPGIKELPPISAPLAAKLPPRKVERVVTPLDKNLKILNLKELPSSKKELKKIFFSLAVATHPDKFEHVDKGTKTEIAIIDKFREIHSAYEFIEKEIEKMNKDSNDT